MTVDAILTADWHIQEHAPMARSAEEDWFEAMDRPLAQIRRLQKKYQCPVIIAGDIFTNWNASAKLINWLLDRMPDKAYAIPGNHDLPHHRYADIEKSAYWTLIKCGRLTNISVSAEGRTLTESPVYLYGFTCGFPPRPCPDKQNDFVTRLLVCHRYLWIKGYSYKDANEKFKLGKIKDIISTYDAALFGDNHRGFISMVGRNPVLQPVINPGTLMRRRIDEEQYQPFIGLLKEGKILRKNLNCKQDKFIGIKDKLTPLYIEDLVNSLKNVSTDFAEEFYNTIDSIIKENEDYPQGVIENLKSLLEKVGKK